MQQYPKNTIDYYFQRIDTFLTVTRNRVDNQAGLVEVLSIGNDQHIKRAAKLARGGEAIATFLGGTAGIVGDGANVKFVEKVSLAKGEKRERRTMAGLLTAEEVIEIADIEEVPPSLKKAFADPGELTSRLGNVAFFRFTVKRKLGGKIPPSMISKSKEGREIFQAFIPAGNFTLEALCRAMDKAAIKWKAGTSLNPSGDPEIVDQNNAVTFVRENRALRIYIQGKESNPRRHWGSYPIIQAFRDRLTLVRSGFIPEKHLGEVLGSKLEIINSSKPNYAQTDFPEEFAPLTRGKRRMAILLYLEGSSPEEIMEKLLTNTEV